MACTSLTTACAFLANLASFICPVRLFGIFMALLVITNYFLVLTFFPCILVLHYRCCRVSFPAPLFGPLFSFFSWTKLTGAAVQFKINEVEFSPLVECASSDSVVDSTLEGANLGEQEVREEEKVRARKTEEWKNVDLIPLSAEEEEAEGVGSSILGSRTLHGLLKWFRDHPADSAPGHSPGMGGARVHALLGCEVPALLAHWRWTISLLALLLSTFMAAAATQFAEPVERMSMWPTSHPLYLYFEVEQQFAFGRQMDAVGISFIFGLDVEKVGLGGGGWDPAAEYSPAVPLAPGFQLSTPQEQEWVLGVCRQLCSPTAELKKHMSRVSSPCFLQVMDQEFLAPRNLSLPLPADQFQPLFLEFSSMKGHQSGSRFLANTSILADMSFGVQSAVVWHEEPHLLLQEWEFWDQWLSTQLVSAPPSLQSGFVTSSYFRYAETYRILKNSAFRSLGLSMLATWSVLLLSTRSFRLAAAATTCIACVAVDFIGFMVLSGWSLGIVESICMTVVVGLSVDYIVHIAHAYVRSKSDTNEKRIGEALQRMGVSVACGALTSIGGSCFLLGCVIVFFNKFGTFIVVTLSDAFVRAVIVFPAMCAIVGRDDGEFDDFTWFLRKIGFSEAFSTIKCRIWNARSKTDN